MKKKSNFPNYPNDVGENSIQHIGFERFSKLFEVVNNTHRFLGLSLEHLDLALEFVNEILVPLLVLPVLVSLEGELLESAISLPHGNQGLRVAALFLVQLTL